MLEISIIWPWEVAVSLSGKTVIVVDILAASSNIANLLSKGVSDLILVNKDNVLIYKEKYPDAKVIGESMDPALKNIFYCNNSAFNIDKLDAKGQRVLYMSNNGSRVIEEVLRRYPTNILVGSLTAASSLRKWIHKEKIADLVIVPAGEINLPKDLPGKEAMEDMICSEVLKDIILDNPISYTEKLEKAKNFIRKFYGVFTKTLKEEIEIVFAIDRYDVVPLCKMEDDGTLRIINSAKISPSPLALYFIFG